MIPISMVVGQEKGVLVAAFVREPETDQERSVLQLLEEHKIPTFVGQLDDARSLVEFSNCLDLGYRYSPAFRRVTNISEARLMRTVKSALNIFSEKEIQEWPGGWQRDLIRGISDEAAARFRIYEEVAIPQIIKPEPGGSLGNRFSAHRVDLLVASAPPLSKPLFVVEFDGPWHDDPQNAKKDDERDKFLLENSLPVLRISYRNYPLSEGFADGVGNVGSYFAVLIGRMSEVVEEEFIKKKVYWGEFYRKKREMLERSISGYKKANRVIQVPREALIEMVDEIEMDTYFESVDLGVEWNVRGLEDAESWKRRLSVSEYKYLQEFLSSGVDLEIEESGCFEEGLEVSFRMRSEKRVSDAIFGPFYGALKVPEMFSGKLGSLTVEAATVTGLEALDGECGEWILEREENQRQ
ncbi:DUF2726 domain-containing protein [Thioalkalivibrio sp. AKL10]|uniref:DUF2726 domain-containing protein n=1 Tax=Thioalkalivibrio sp. AKL10 TaxID=1158158 RepID=UPI00036C48AA|nr:DUF2726 domain-containing protein [Thioalkalivibrio sp. AKL10]